MSASSITLPVYPGRSYLNTVAKGVHNYQHWIRGDRAPFPLSFTEAVLLLPDEFLFLAERHRAISPLRSAVLEKLRGDEAGELAICPEHRSDLIAFLKLTDAETDRN